MVANCGCLGSSGYPSKCKDTKTNDLGAIIVPQHWSELNQILQDLLPSDDELTYVVESYVEKECYHFEGKFLI